MQIDFHHATTYVVARLAGFEHDPAAIIAHAAQYVDDATSSGMICFTTGAMYQRLSSAHKMLDLRNAEELANHQVWLPFHFLPGNDGLSAGQHPDGSFIRKIVCKPDSHIARQMVRQAILDQNRPCGLHRLGITMHVYADTWAHQGFAGVDHKINRVEDPVETGNSGVFNSGLKKFMLDVMDDMAPPLGHGQANVLPDMPFLAWEYKNGHGEAISRDNTSQFCQAADQLCRAMQCYLARDPNGETVGIGDRDMQKIEKLFRTLKDEDGEKRHQAWLTAIAQDPFSFGPENLSYTAKQNASWKEQALGTNEDRPEYSWDKKFLRSNWKLFHDAVQAHRLYVLHDLLPRYGICAA